MNETNNLLNSTITEQDMEDMERNLPIDYPGITLGEATIDLKTGEIVEPGESPAKKISFKDFKEKTATDCEQIAGFLKELAAEVREGNFKAFEEWWVEGGTEEGDAKIDSIREILLLRYAVRSNSLE